jgi:hypothetical protein
VTFLANVLAAKRVELVNEVAPRASLIGLLVNPDNPNAVSETSDMETATRAIGKRWGRAGAWLTFSIAWRAWFRPAGYGYDDLYLVGILR